MTVSSEVRLHPKLVGKLTGLFNKFRPHLQHKEHITSQIVFAPAALAIAQQADSATAAIFESSAYER